jgi:hypothetical protein
MSDVHADAQNDPGYAEARAEAECREVASNFPEPNVLRAIRLAEQGTLTWTDIHGVFAEALQLGIDAVEAGLGTHQYRPSKDVPFSQAGPNCAVCGLPEHTPGVHA